MLDGDVTACDEGPGAGCAKITAGMRSAERASVVFIENDQLDNSIPGHSIECYSIL